MNVKTLVDYVDIVML